MHPSEINEPEIIPSPPALPDAQRSGDDSAVATPAADAPLIPSEPASLPESVNQQPVRRAAPTPASRSTLPIRTFHWLVEHRGFWLAAIAIVFAYLGQQIYTSFKGVLIEDYGAAPLLYLIGCALIVIAFLFTYKTKVFFRSGNYYPASEGVNPPTNNIVVALKEAWSRPGRDRLFAVPWWRGLLLIGAALTAWLGVSRWLAMPLDANTTNDLHSDHLGSVNLATDGSTGALVSNQQFDPWGSVRSGGIGQTKLNYTGQKKDDSGLLYYGSRYYDPALARFVSADSIVPGAAMGTGGALGTLGIGKNTSMKGLTTDYHEDGMALAVNGENQYTVQKGFYFQLSSQDKQKSKIPYGPLNPQALNRYSYVLNNPVRYVDPTGHYYYDYNWDIGPASSNFTPETAMAYIQQNPNSVFPFGVDGTNGETSLVYGSTYNLTNIGLGLPPFLNNVVTVSALTSNSFTFKAVSGLDPKGSTITFYTYIGANGDVYLEMIGRTTSAVPGVDWAIPAGANIAWGQFADNLRNKFFPVPAPFPYNQAPICSMGECYYPH